MDYGSAGQLKQFIPSVKREHDTKRTDGLRSAGQFKQFSRSVKGNTTLRGQMDYGSADQLK